jgi:large subunit ribosomal protein L28
MAHSCEICGKGPMFGNRISHAHNNTKRRWEPNLRRVHAMVNGARRAIMACTACIRAGKIVK